MNKQKDNYKEMKIFHNGKTRVYIPDITPEERERRMNEIKKAAVRLVMSERKRQERN